MITRRLTAVVALAATAVLLPSLDQAHADVVPPTGAPDWSGMDVRDAAAGAPGELLGQAPMAPRLSVPGAARAIRIHYGTPDQHGRPASSTGAVFLPRRTPPRGGWPVVAWAHGTVGLGDTCTPSAQPRSDRDSFYLSHWLNQGYAVVATDYVGLGTPGLMSYLNGNTEAHSIVDSVKAARRLGLPLARRWAIVGQSQGAGAAMAGAHAATRLARGTALDYRGVVATGTPANIEHVVALTGPWETLPLPVGLATYTGYILAGFSEARPDLHVEKVLTPLGRRVVRQARTRCYPEMAEWVPRDIGRWFSAPLRSIPGVLPALTAYMGTPVTGYDRPIFLGQGLRDIDVPAPSALLLYTQLRTNNQPVKLFVYPDRDHSGTVYASIRDSTPFLARIMR